jgi:hypothetical protein
VNGEILIFPDAEGVPVRATLVTDMSWAWEHDLVDALPRFAKRKPQRDVAGRHYLTKPEIDSLYFATHWQPHGTS